jgi:hypothetical protein
VTIAGFISVASQKETGGVIRERGAHYILPEHNGRGRLYDTDFYDIDRPSPDSFEGRILSLERVDEVISQARRSGESVIADIDLDFFNPYYPEAPAESVERYQRGRVDPKFSFAEALSRVTAVARQADLVTIATSPNYFLVHGAKRETKWLIEQIIAGL